jgi:hypothetical protein
MAEFVPSQDWVTCFVRSTNRSLEIRQADGIRPVWAETERVGAIRCASGLRGPTRDHDILNVCVMRHGHVGAVGHEDLYRGEKIQIMSHHVV